jgi:hypothetical protein
MAGFKCNKCTKSFDTEAGLNMHRRRSHTAAGKTWGQGKTATPRKNNKGLTIRERVRRALADDPNGMPIKAIIASMKKSGYRETGDVAAYVSQTCSNDPTIQRIDRGIYRLKNPPVATPEESKPEATHTQQEVAQSVPALLVRIDQLEKENAALRNAHLTFVREIGA